VHWLPRNHGWRNQDGVREERSKMIGDVFAAFAMVIMLAIGTKGGEPMSAYFLVFLGAVIWFTLADILRELKR
jgi:hypothetical protein